MELKLPKMGAKVKLKELAVFSRQFATMINSGLSMLRALSILEEQQPNKAFQAILTETRLEVESGSALSISMAKHPEIFPPLMVNMIRAGEVGGFLDKVLVQIADNYESEVRLRGKVKSAMTYPVVVLIMADPADHRHAALHRADLRRPVHLARRSAPGTDRDPGRRCRTSSRSRSSRSSSSR